MNPPLILSRFRYWFSQQWNSKMLREYKVYHIADSVSVGQSFALECTLINTDFKSAFGHMPIAPRDIPLLGFY